MSSETPPQPQFLTLTELTLNYALFGGVGFWIAGSVGACCGLGLVTARYAYRAWKAASNGEKKPTLHDLFQDFLAVPREDLPARETILKETHRLLASATPNDWDWLSNSLEEDQRKWFVASIFAGFPVPTRLLNTMLRAAVYEVDPSRNQEFISPSVSSFGHRVVNEGLLDFVEKGTDFEKAGAVSALYWGGMSLSFPEKTDKFTIENATPASRAAYLELKDVWERKRCVFLREFVSNENVDVRRNIISSVRLERADYPADIEPLVLKAIEIARSHPDEYIRHRVEVQLGNERLLYPLPPRT